MALSKTINYTPFQETNFGYTAGEIIAVAGGNATDIITVAITNMNFWDETGHISTPSSGTAVSRYDSSTREWTIKGERDDVDAAMVNLLFSPADRPQSRPYNVSTNPTGWAPTTTKTNETSGVYTDEEPPSISTTTATITLYDAGLSVTSSGSINAVAVQPTDGNQRPYWTTEPARYKERVHGSGQDFGVVSHGADTENIQIKCEFRDYGTTNQYVSSIPRFGDPDDLYIGNKKPGTRNNTDSRFNFTGSVAETQSFLDGVKLELANSAPTLDLYFTLTDGVVGTEFTQTMWNSENTVEATTFPDQSVNEDYPLTLNRGSFAFTNDDDIPETNVVGSGLWTATFTIDATGQAGIASVTGTNTTYSNGVITTTANSGVQLEAMLSSVNITFNADFNTEFTMTLDVNAQNATVGSSYDMTQQSINVTIADIDEYTITQPANINWTEEYAKQFDSGIEIIDNAFSGTSTYTVTARARDNDDNAFDTMVWNSYLKGSASQTGTGTVADPLILTGTRSDINTALSHLQMINNNVFDFTNSPAADGGFYFEYRIVRNQDSSNTDFPNYESSTRTNFNAGIPQKELDFPTTVYFVNDPTARFDSDDSFYAMQDVEIVEPYPTLNYTLTLSYPNTHSFYRNGGLYSTNENYVDDDYVDTEYVTHDLVLSDTRQNINTLLSELTLIGSGDVDIDYTLERAGTSGNVDTGTINFVEVATPVVGTATSTQHNAQNTSSDYTTYTQFDVFKTYTDGSVTITLPVTYTGDHSDISIRPWSNLSAVRKNAWTSSAKNTNQVSDSTSFNDFTLLSVLYETGAITKSTNGNTCTFTIPNENGLLQPESTGEFEEFIPEILVENVDGPDFYITGTSQESFITGKNVVSAASALDHDEKMLFLPYSVTEINEISDVNFDAYINSTSAYGQLSVNRYWNHLIGQPNATMAPLSNFHKGTNNGKVESLFGADSFSANNLYYLRFHTTDLTQSSGDVYGKLDNIAVSYDNDSSKQIFIDNSTGGGFNNISVPVDVLYDEVGNKVYALVKHLTTNAWQFWSVDATNSTDLNVSNGATLEASGTDVLLGGSIGRLANGEITFTIANSTNGRFDVYHQNTGGSGNFGLQQSITRSTWGGTNVNFASYFTQHVGDGSWVQSNLKGWMLLGTFLYYWNTTTSNWDEVDSNDLNTNIQNSNGLLYKQALSENVVCKIRNSDPTGSDTRFYRLGRTGFLSHKAYNTGTDSPTYARSSKRGDVFITGINTTTTIYRFKG